VKYRTTHFQISPYHFDQSAASVSKQENDKRSAKNSAPHIWESSDSFPTIGSVVIESWRPRSWDISALAREIVSGSHYCA
jgi:hypothetical protein